MPETTFTETPAPEPVAGSAETTAIAEKVGEHNVQVAEAQQTAQTAAATSEAAAATAAAATEAASAPHAHEEYATKADLQGVGDRLAAVLEERLPKPAEPEAVKTPPVKVPDEPPQSREKKVEKRSLAARFYGNRPK